MRTISNPRRSAVLAVACGAVLALAGCAASPLPLPVPSESATTTPESATATPLDAARVKKLCADRPLLEKAAPATEDKIHAWTGTTVWSCRVSPSGEVLEVSDQLWKEGEIPAAALPNLIPGAPIPSGCTEMPEKAYVLETPTDVWQMRLVQCSTLAGAAPMPG